MSVRADREARRVSIFIAESPERVMGVARRGLREVMRSESNVGEVLRGLFSGGGALKARRALVIVVPPILVFVDFMSREGLHS